MSSPPTSPQDLRQHLNDKRKHLAARFCKAGDVATYLAGHTRMVDEVIQAWARSFLSSDVGILALAGYGRERLFPLSDVDLLVVRRDPATVDPALKRCLQQLWDAGLKLSQQVCTPAELETLERADWEFVLALQNLRPLWGCPDLIQGVISLTRPLPPSWSSEDLLSVLLKAVGDRHRRFENTIYHLEPDLKNGPGGLRDAHILELLGRLTGKPAQQAPPELAAAESVIGFMRVCLHLLTRRDQNRLTHRLQEQVAKMLRPCPPPAQAVETLMEEYFRDARRIDSRLRRTLGHLQSSSTTGCSFKNIHQLLKHLTDLLERRQSPNHSLLDSIHQRAGQIARGVVHPLLGNALIELFRPRPGLFSILRELHDAGLLVVLFPEFESVQNRMVRDFYHRYTVDEHSLRAIRECEQLSQPEHATDRRFAALLEEVSFPSALTLSLLLHDVGKGQGGNHSETGAGMARRALGRFRLADSLIDDVEFLIRNHLAMSSLIQKRDLNDDAVIGEFADLVGNVERLRLLCLLTLCDISAVSPDAMTHWRRDRLWQLYVAAYNKLTRGYGEERIAPHHDHQALTAQLPAELEAKEFEQFLDGFPRRYLSSTAPEEVYRHFRMALAVTREDPIQVRLTELDGHHRLCVLTRDRQNLFGRIAGLISYFEMNIGRGHGFSNRAGLVLDIIEFSDPSGIMKRETRQGEGFLDLLRGAILNQLSVSQLLRRKEQSVIFRPSTPSFQPLITFQDATCGTYSILELVAPDALGLLYRIATQMARLDCNIELVLINTEGNRAIDVFYLTYNGKKLDDDRKSKLQNEILGAISQDETV